MTSSPTLSRRRLGRELRILREDADLSPQAVADQLDVSASTVSRIENGRVSIRSRDLDFLLSLFGVTDVEVRGKLLELAREGRSKGWWHPFALELDEAFATLIDLESGASQLRVQHPLLIPGLLQTESYGESLLTQLYPDLSQKVRRNTLDLRSSRRSALTAKGTKMWFILDEMGLRRPIADRTAHLEQLRSLASMCENPVFTIQVVPQQQGFHPAMDSNFTILSFEDSDDVVSVDTLVGGVFYEGEDEVQRYLEAFKKLAEIALPSAESTQLIERIEI
jgi:transcriptional regulator with XRE-family HTH domain